MRVRIRKRRESVGESPCEPDGQRGFTSALRLLNGLGSRTSAIEAAGVDERLPALMAAIKSARLIIEMSAQSSETTKHLKPCATAALLHVRSEILLIASKGGERSQNPAGAPYPCRLSSVAP
jgi:hypothetical protein